MSERSPLPPARELNAVGFCLTAIRIWQWASSFLVYASFGLLYGHIQSNRLGGNERMKGVQVLGLVSLVYSTLVVCCVHVFRTLDIRLWRFFAVMSLPGDLTIMGICLAQITILSYSGLPADCHGLTRDNYDGSDLVRQPADGFTTIRFGSWNHKLSGELDGLCTFPRTVYGLSVAAVFSYTFSVLLSVLYLQRQGCEAPLDNEKAAGGRPAVNNEGGASGMPSAAITHGPSSSSSSSSSSYSSRPRSLVSSSSNSSHHHHTPPRSASPPQGSSYSTAPSYHSRASLRHPWWWSEVGLRGGGGGGSGGAGGSGGPTSRVSSSSTWGGATATAATTTTLVSDDTDYSIRSGTSGQPRWGGSGRAEGPGVGGGGGGWGRDDDVPGVMMAVEGEPPEPSGRREDPASSSYDADGSLPSGPADPPGYSSRPGSLYHEPMKYEAGLVFPNCGSPSS